ncbi:uncharacterized protein LOC117111092 [Anneissia japonica]|uniref:uncharacterized protein LOC117111092 n=1 Tax=Anneissia japonica TaxID=1529436 RepID=UPI0014258EB2|nr:uncharacterized protein LOC117111092 [Anneissia japonica]
MAQLYIVEEFEERRIKGSGKSFLIGMVWESVKKGDSTVEETVVKSQVVPCYVNDVNTEMARRLLALNARTRIVMTNITRLPGSLRATKTSKVLARVSDFPVCMETVESFIKPEVVSVAEARGSPVKRRMSVCGDVVEIGEFVDGHAYKRRSLQLEDGGSVGRECES